MVVSMGHVLSLQVESVCISALASVIFGAFLRFPGLWVLVGNGREAAESSKQDTRVFLKSCPVWFYVKSANIASKNMNVYFGYRCPSQVLRFCRQGCQAMDECSVLFPRKPFHLSLMYRLDAQAEPAHTVLCRCRFLLFSATSFNDSGQTT